MATGLGSYVHRNSEDLQNDKNNMPPPPAMHSNRPTILPADENTPRRKEVLGSKFKHTRSLPPTQIPVVSSPQQSAYTGAQKVVHKLNTVGGALQRGSAPAGLAYGYSHGGGERRDVYDTDLGETETEGSVDTVNAMDYNHTRFAGQQGKEEDDDGEFADEEEEHEVGNGQHYANEHIGRELREEESQSSDEEQQGEGESEDEDDQDMPMMQRGQGANPGPNAHWHASNQQQPQRHVQPHQHQQLRDFNMPVRVGSPNNMISRNTDARRQNNQSSARRMAASQPLPQREEDHYDGPDNFAATTVGEEESESEDLSDAMSDPVAADPTQSEFQVAISQPGRQQQQQYTRAPKSRQHNQVLGQEKPLHARIAEHHAIAGVGPFAASELEETLSHDEQIPPQKKRTAKEKRRLSPEPVSRKRAASPELDYDKSTLFKMPYSELASQRFEAKPPDHRPTAVSVRGKTLADKLDKASQLDDAARLEFLSGLSIKEWEEAGGWFVSKFGDVMNKLVELRRERREIAERFERKLAERDADVQASVQRLQDEMADMRKGGEGILRGKSPGGF